MESSSGVRVSEQKLPERDQLGIFSPARSLQTANKSLRIASERPWSFIRAPVINCQSPRKTSLLRCTCTQTAPRSRTTNPMKPFPLVSKATENPPRPSGVRFRFLQIRSRPSRSLSAYESQTWYVCAPGYPHNEECSSSQVHYYVSAASPTRSSHSFVSASKSAGCPNLERVCASSDLTTSI